MEKRELHSVLTDFLNENLIQATASGQAEKNDFLKARIRRYWQRASCIFRRRNLSENRLSTKI